jgi:glycosyltransferase involved in cell wall biosynthesis
VKRVLIILPDFGFGGAEKSAAAVSRLLAQKYFVHFLVFNERSQPAYPIGGNIHSLQVDGGGGFLNKVVAFITRVYRARLLKGKLQIDVSISFLEGADYVNFFSCRGEKLICSIRGSKQHDPNIVGALGWLRHKILMPLVYSRVDAVVVVNPSIAQEMKKFYRVGEWRIVPIFNFYDITALQGLASEPLGADVEKELETRQAIVAVGRLAPEKAFDHLISAFNLVKSRLNNAVLLLVGSGSELEHLIVSATKFGLTYQMGASLPLADVCFVGYQKNPLKWVKRAKVFVLSSVIEGFPNVLLEAMAVGTPVLATDCNYGPREVLQTDNTFGLLMDVIATGTAIDHPSHGKWADYIIRILTDEQKRNELITNGYQRASEFSEEKISPQWFQLIEKICP